MHKPDPKLAPEAQDKRSVVAIEPKDVDQWLQSSIEDAARLVASTSVDAFAAAPVQTSPAFTLGPRR